jgi:hypothetical protein
VQPREEGIEKWPVAGGSGGAGAPVLPIPH